MVFSIVTVPIYVPTSSVRVSLFSTPSSTCVICRLFNEDHSGLRILLDIGDTKS